MAEKKLSLYQKLLEIQKRIIGLGKDKKSFGFDYVTGSKVLEHIKPLMNEYSLLLKQEIISIENTRQDYATKSGSTSEINSKVMQRFTWVDADTGETDENLFGANGQNAWDKGVGSALTYAERYFLLKYFHIATDEDDIDNPERKAEEAAEAKKLMEAEEKKQTEYLAATLKAIEGCTTAEQVSAIWSNNKALQKNEKFVSAIKEKGTALKQAI